VQLRHLQHELHPQVDRQTGRQRLDEFFVMDAQLPQLDRREEDRCPEVVGRDGVPILVAPATVRLEDDGVRLLLLHLLEQSLDF